MRIDTPPPEEDALSDGIPAGLDDIEIIEDVDVEDYVDEGDDNFDEAKLTFYGHAGPVFCCAFDKDMQYVATGGQDDKAFLWDPNNGEPILECTGFKDSVCSVGFSHDSKYVAAADMSGVVQVWNLADKTVAWNFDLGEDLKLLEWHKASNVLFAGADDGSCWMWRIPSGETKTFQNCHSSCTCGHIMPDGLRSVVGFDDGTVRFLDLKTAELVHSITGQLAHKGPVTTLDCHQDNNLVITGSTDGTAKLIKSTDGRVLCTLRCEPDDQEHKSVECVAFFTSHSLIASGTVCGSLAIWDTATQVRRLQCEQESGITKLICDSSGPMVYTAGVDGLVRLIDGRTGQLEKVWGGHAASVLDFLLSSDGSTIVTCSDDGSCKIYEVRR